MVKMMFKSVFYRIYAIFINFNLRGVFVGRSAVISLDSKINDQVKILDYCRLFNTSIDKYSYVSPFSILIDCEIGKYTSIGPGCRIGLGVHPIDQVSTSPYFYNDHVFKKRNPNDFTVVIIGHDVWIGANALIMGGVNIGDGAVIGAGAVVTKDVEPYSVVVGVPAKEVKKRFDSKVIENILKEKWWDRDHKELLKQRRDFKSPKNFKLQ